MKTVVVGMMTYVVDRPAAAAILALAHAAWKESDLDRARELRRLALQVESGQVDGETALAQVEALPKAA